MPGTARTPRRSTWSHRRTIGGPRETGGSSTASWDSIVKAWRFTAATDTDGNGLVENTKFGHGWVEGGALYPPHEEIYQQGVWIEACRGLAELADVRAEGPGRGGAGVGRAHSGRRREDVLARGPRPLRLRHRAPAREAEGGRARAGARAAAGAARGPRARRSFWTRTRCCPRSPCGGGCSTPSGRSRRSTTSAAPPSPPTGAQRLLSDRSALYDPLSYHYGSVWPLFTGWTSMAAYRYGRPHVGYQALMANALLRSRAPSAT